MTRGIDRLVLAVTIGTLLTACGAPTPLPTAEPAQPPPAAIDNLTTEEVKACEQAGESYLSGGISIGDLTALCSGSSAPAAPSEKTPAAAVPQEVFAEYDHALADYLSQYNKPDPKKPEAKPMAAASIIDTLVKRAEKYVQVEQMPLAFIDLMAANTWMSRDVGIKQETKNTLQANLDKVWGEVTADPQFDKLMSMAILKTQEQANALMISAQKDSQTKLYSEWAYTKGKNDYQGFVDKMKKQYPRKNILESEEAWAKSNFGGMDQLKNKFQEIYASQETWQDYILNDPEFGYIPSLKIEGVNNLQDAYTRYTKNVGDRFGEMTLQNYTVDDFKRWILGFTPEMNMVNVPNDQIGQIFELNLAKQILALMENASVTKMSKVATLASPVPVFDTLWESLTSDEQKKLQATYPKILQDPNKLNVLKEQLQNPSDELVRKATAVGVARYISHLAQEQYGPGAWYRVGQIEYAEGYIKGNPKPVATFSNPIELGKIIPPQLSPETDIAHAPSLLPFAKFMVRMRVPKQSDGTELKTFYFESSLSSDLNIKALSLGVRFFSANGQKVDTSIGGVSPFVPVLVAVEKKGKQSLRLISPDQVDGVAKFWGDAGYIVQLTNKTYNQNMVFEEKLQDSAGKWALINLPSGMVLTPLLAPLEQEESTYLMRWLPGYQHPLINDKFSDWKAMVKNHPRAEIYPYLWKFLGVNLYNPASKIKPFESLETQKLVSTGVIGQKPVNFRDGSWRMVPQILPADNISTQGRIFEPIPRLSGESGVNLLTALKNPNMFFLKEIVKDKEYLMVNADDVIVSPLYTTPTEQFDSLAATVIVASAIGQQFTPELVLFKFLNTYNVPIHPFTYGFFEQIFFNAVMVQ